MVLMGQGGAGGLSPDWSMCGPSVISHKSCPVQVLGHLSGRGRAISWCRGAGRGVRAEITQALGGITAKKYTDGKRKSDAAAAASSVLDSAAQAAAKCLRPSSPCGSDAGAEGIVSAFAKQVVVGRDSRAPKAIADMITSEGLPGDFAQKGHRGFRGASSLSRLQDFGLRMYVGAQAV